MTNRGDVLAELAAQLPSLLAPILAKLLGGKGVDAQRQARADWFKVHAMVGRSVVAARVLLGGRENTAGHERPMYDVAIATVTANAPEVMRAAVKQGPYWDEHDNATSEAMRAKVNAELAARKPSRRKPSKRRGTP